MGLIVAQDGDVCQVAFALVAVDQASDTLHMFRWHAPLCLAVVLAGCGPSPQPGGPFPKKTVLPGSGRYPNQESTLREIHSAAENMALDAFRTGASEIGWPREAAASESREYLRLLAEKGYWKAPSDPEGIKVANVGEADPLDAALAAVTLSDGSLLVVRKDGAIREAADLTRVTEIARIPATDPPWLP